MKENPSTLIDLLGGTTAVAKLTDSSLGSVSEWRKYGIPQGKLFLMAYPLEKETKGKITRKKLFPETWKQVWPELEKK
jgi:hypothetical protein